MTFVKRADKIMFMEVDTEFNRMKGFTSLSTNKNPKEYTRQYVDEPFEATDLVAISTSTDFTFDQKVGDPVHDKMVSIIDGEKIGDDAVVTLLLVDFTKKGSTPGSFKAVKRDFTLIPGTEGDSLDAYTYGGTFKVKGPRIEGEATSIDDFEKTCTFVQEGETGI